MRRATSACALLAIVLWLGGLLSLGAIAAPVVFSVVSTPSAADAMTIVFRRFDILAMTCAAVVLFCEGSQAIAVARIARVDMVRAAAEALAAAMAVAEGTQVSPRIAHLHFAGVARGWGDAGAELARLHELAELLGKGQAVLLATAVVLYVIGLTSPQLGNERKGSSS